MSASIFNLRSTRRLIRFALAVLCAAALAALWRPSLSQPSHQRHAMNALTSRIKTVCFGRYLVNIPVEADFSVGDAYSESIKFERTPSYVDEQDYRMRLRELEERLRASKHDTEGSLLRSILPVNEGKQVLFLSRPEAARSRTTLVETFLIRPPYRMSFVAADESIERISARIERISKVVTWRDATIPSRTGACITDALIDFVPTYNESFYAGTGMDAPAWVISLSTDTTGPTDSGKDLHSRVDQAIEMLGPAGSEIKKLRRGFVMVDGRKGREYLGIYPSNRDGPTETFDAKLEVEGSGKPQQPTIKVTMETVWPKRRDPSDPTRYLSQQEAMALWDSVVKSVRMRPGAF
jgi:Tle cognate immunity protein 4 C-terminal domain/Tle cognate immunity protein 4 N-terminal domain